MWTEVAFVLKYGFHSVTYVFVIIDNEDFGMFTQILSPPTSSFGSIGNTSVKVVPRFFAVLTAIDPPWASTMRLHIAKPKPIPFALVVNKG